MNPHLPVPFPNPDSQPYWEAARNEDLVIRKCKDCGQLHFMPRHLCPHCWSTELEWVKASGRATVHSFTVIRRAPIPSYADRVPYVVALVDLEEGPRMLTNIVGDDALNTQVGSAVEVRFEDRADLKLPQFALAKA
jgi:uncharacterized protein